MCVCVRVACRWGNNAGRRWRGNRNPTASVNFVCAHDGFTLADLVAYNDKHNDANGENNKDGESHNLSWNCGAEGPTDRLDVTRCGGCCVGWWVGAGKRVRSLGGMYVMFHSVCVCGGGGGVQGGQGIGSGGQFAGQ
jgi:hypothetical protein